MILEEGGFIKEKINPNTILKYVLYVNNIGNVLCYTQFYSP